MIVIARISVGTAVLVTSNMCAHRETEGSFLPLVLATPFLFLGATTIIGVNILSATPCRNLGAEIARRLIQRRVMNRLVQLGPHPEPNKF